VTHTGNARLVLVSARAAEAKLTPDLEKLISLLDGKSLPPVHYTAGALVLDRLRARDPSAAQAHFFGLVNPNTQSGVFVNSAPVADLAETRTPELLDYLAANLYAGGGAHSLWARTAASGLAYSNGIGASPFIGRLRYYAERCTDLATTMRFVIDELRHARPDARLGDYALALAFGSRVSETYEARATGLATDLSDGVTPELVRTFRTHLIALRAQPGFATQLFARMNAVYARVLPGLEPLTLPTADTVAFVIGPERQLAAYESYLHGLWGDQAKLARLYPRDFWAPVKPLRPSRR
jgi:hypothetical protein